MDEKEQQKEQIRKLGQEAVAQSKQKQLEVEEKVSQRLANIQEIMLETQKLVEQWTKKMPAEPPVKENHLKLVPPIKKREEEETTSKSSLDKPDEIRE
ncbi:hypothetical protein BCR24_11570 [Enterococcus ureilyticus]|uniref:Uncharacterized protein n=1 Tax=Enterococcus ureilyticus TaxID=1131292 RepID=A0A1E5HEP9_9ENTE|nr:hypothetical protein [Enterococcus ureilyticus]MBM7687343.1 hypothetical protein [Enterococcus ureilyticus]MBO0447579.1 hypothetical protein [Enterococcus ureilyticus]OEG23403.1 hypothetical protein BCR24_11570 [Enterococcus ureilyticus]